MVLRGPAIVNEHRRTWTNETTTETAVTFRCA